MNSFRFLLSLYFLLGLTTFAAGADWPPITDADRQFTSVPGDPSAPAVILYREQTDDNMNNFLAVYERRKILTAEGRRYATIELPSGRTFSIDMVSGRTIHANGLITPFQERPVEQTVTRDGKQLTVKTFTLPDAEVGSILDFRYRLRYMDFRVFPPEWDVQTDLFQRNAYFKFIPMQNRVLQASGCRTENSPGISHGPHSWATQPSPKYTPSLPRHTLPCTTSCFGLTYTRTMSLRLLPSHSCLPSP